MNSSHIDYACDVVLCSEFSSQADLDTYAGHPYQLWVKAKLANLGIARHQVDQSV